MEGYVARASELGMAREALAAALRDMMTAAGEPGEEGTDDDATRVPGSSSCAVSETEAEAVMEAFLTAYDRELSQVARQTRLDTAALEVSPLHEALIFVLMSSCVLYMISV
jgi:acyl-CoA hydrolase